MIISMMHSIKAIHTKPKYEAKPVISNKVRAANQDVNRTICLKLIINGEKDIDVIAKHLKVQRVTVIKYLKFLQSENLINFVCNAKSKTEIIGAV